MPLYYFDTDDGTKLYRDDIGTELADDQAARDEGTRALAEMARDYISKTDKPQKNISMWVRNEAGQAVLQLSVSFAVQKLK
jgi:hypothetical protein